MKQLDAEALCRQLAEQIRPHVTPATALVGIYTGRTTRAALNELFDFGRPAAVELAVLVDRGSRELPIAARYCAHTLPEALPRDQSLELQRDDTGGFTLKLTQRT